MRGCGTLILHLLFRTPYRPRQIFEFSQSGTLRNPLDDRWICNQIVVDFPLISGEQNQFNEFLELVSNRIRNKDGGLA
jgi:hypothetical protein